ncbi:MAG: hypothetical protein WC450_05940 [Candidatus Omnitrophota bacterium]|jgi:hypothetical protein
MTQKYFEKKSALIYLFIGILSGCLFFGIGHTVGLRQSTPLIAGEWLLKSYDSTGAPVGKSAVITIAQDPGQMVTLLEGTRTYEGYINKNTIHLTTPCVKTQNCDSTEVQGVISGEVLSGTWKDIKNEEIVNAGRWLAEKNRGEFRKCDQKDLGVPNINGNWSFKIFNKDGLAEERTIVIFQEGQRITIREQEEEFKGYVNNNELFAYSVVPDKNEIVEIEGTISGNTISGEWQVQTGKVLVEEGTWEAQKK